MIHLDSILSKETTKLTAKNSMQTEKMGMKTP